MRYPAKETAMSHERMMKEDSRLFRERKFEKGSVGKLMNAAGLLQGAFGSKDEPVGDDLCGNDLAAIGL